MMRWAELPFWQQPHVLRYAMHWPKWRLHLRTPSEPLTGLWEQTCCYSFYRMGECIAYCSRKGGTVTITQQASKPWFHGMMVANYNFNIPWVPFWCCQLWLLTYSCICLSQSEQCVSHGVFSSCLTWQWSGLYPRLFRLRQTNAWVG